jgi:DMSO/TMAO reductase YedYZ molybdopterin-dependent catalytic subunit
VTGVSLPRRAFLRTGALAAGAAWMASALPPFARDALTALPSPDLIVRNEWPEHWETSVAALGRSLITPEDRFFVRTHFPVPEIDERAWRLEITGLVERPQTLTLAELRALPVVKRTAILECAGNGRGLFPSATTSGTQWERGAVGNGDWSGVALKTVLERAGVKEGAGHVWFEAADEAPLPGPPKFLRSIPLDKAQDDALLAHTMNGAKLTRRHGGPLRLVVPGWFGMAWSKWVTKIRVEKESSDNHFMARSYHYNVAGTAPASAPGVETLRVKSLITSPLTDTQVRPGRLVAHGFAWAGPSGVARLELSTDDGHTWADAPLGGTQDGYAWRPWRAEIDVRPNQEIVLCARASDGNGDTQPEQASANASGYANNSIHRVVVHGAA